MAKISLSNSIGNNLFYFLGLNGAFSQYYAQRVISNTKIIIIVTRRYNYRAHLTSEYYRPRGFLAQITMPDTKKICSQTKGSKYGLPNLIESNLCHSRGPICPAVASNLSVNNKGDTLLQLPLPPPSSNDHRKIQVPYRATMGAMQRKVKRGPYFR